jgi:hypothetical protein
MKNDPIETALAQLDEATPEALRKALGSKYSLVIGKAARLIGDKLLTDFAEPLASAFSRLLAKPESDKGCLALTAIARTLVRLDHDDAELFRRGMKHVQMEATYGGSIDVASEFRATCAMGLANSRDHKKLQPLVELLADREWPARAGAVKAIATVGSDAAALLLRYKALLGDPEPYVLSECLAGLIAVDGAEALPFVGRIAESRDRDTSEAAVLALGASRRPDAVEWLKTRFEQVADADTKKCIVLALASARTEGAMDYLIEIVRCSSTQLAAAAVAAMGISDEVRKAAQARPDAATLLRGQ